MSEQSDKLLLPTVTDCDRCGICCLHMGYPEFVQASERGPAEVHWDRMPGDLKDELLRYVESYQSVPGELDGPCFWFDQETRSCKHHQHRPNVCRDFVVGGRECQAWREHYGDKIGSSPAALSFDL